MSDSHRFEAQGAKVVAVNSPLRLHGAGMNQSSLGAIGTPLLNAAIG